jgi:putative transposase
MKQQLVSERRSCQLIGIWRSSYRYQPVVRDDGELVTRLHGIAVEDETAGYRTAWAYLRQDGMLVNHKRVQRVWKEEGLTQPIKKGRKRAKGGAVPLQATHANHVWTYDFIHDRTEDGQPLRFLTVEDEYTREGLAVAAERSMPADRVIEVLKVLFRERGTPEYLRSDNVLTPESTFLGRAMVPFAAAWFAQPFHELR